MKLLLNTLLLSIFSLLTFQLTAQDLHRKDGELPCLNKNFNVAFHIAVDSLNREPIATEELVNTMLEEVSEYFSPICVGTGTFNGIVTEEDANVVIELFNCTDPKHSQNLAHQFGHLFGLYDTHNLNNPEIELVDGSNCDTAGDLICDTPGDPFERTILSPTEPGVFLEGNFFSECEFIFVGLDANGEYWQPDMGNIMSGYPCKCGFTRQQYLKMVEVYQSSDIKQF